MRKVVSFIIIFFFISFYALDYVVGKEDIESAIAKLNSGSEIQRISAENILISNNSERSTEGLISALNNNSAKVRLIAVKELSKRSVPSSYTSNRAVEGLVSAINNQDSNVRHLALTGLRNANSPRATEGIISALNSTDETLQLEAVAGLTEDVALRICKDRSVEGLIQALDSPSVLVRKKALYGLSIAKTNRAKNGLEKALSDNESQVSSLAKRYLYH